MDFFLKQLRHNIERYGSNVAFHIDETDYTYQHLGERISAVQQSLQDFPHQQYFGVVTRNSISTYATIFALWLSGKTSVPLSPKTPFERNRYILDKVGIEIIFDAGVVVLDFEKVTTVSTLNLVLKHFSPELVDVELDRDLYLLFTSGSTGVPKGVRISRGNFDAYLKAFFACGYQFYSSDRCIQVFELTFDASVQCYTFPLLVGATVYTLPDEGIRFLSILKIMQAHQITFVKMTPSTIYYLQPYFDRIKLPALRYCLFGAEAFPVELVKKWEGCIPNAEIHNVYGPTEATINCAHYKWIRNGENKAMNGIASIGKAYSGITAKVFDNQQKPLPANSKGELCVAGAQITKGYWQNPENNRIAFFEAQVNDQLLRFYRTGDLVVMDQDNNLFYLGRIDTQVQINGHRIELSEIENHAINYTKMKCVALVTESDELAHSINLVVESVIFNKEEILEYLRNYLPEYMIPKRIHFVEQMPLLSSGKTDRQKLLKLIGDA